METRCHEFFDCPKKKCVMFKAKEKGTCWEHDPRQTPCAKIFIDGTVKMQDKIVFCKNCSYYLLVNNASKVQSHFKFHTA